MNLIDLRDFLMISWSILIKLEDMLFYNYFFYIKLRFTMIILYIVMI